MAAYRHIAAALALIAAAGFAGCGRQAAPDAAPGPQVSGPVAPAGEILLPGVKGRMDHLTVDVKGRRLFVTALESHSIEVVDLDKNKVVKSIPGILEPQGSLYLADHDVLLVCSRGDGTCRSFDGTTFEPGPWADLGINADNLRVDAAGTTVYVGSGGEPGCGYLNEIDLKAMLPAAKGGAPSPQQSGADLLKSAPGRVDARKVIQLESHPESFQVTPDGTKAFVNVPDSKLVAGLDLATGARIASWPVAQEKNFPLVLDAASMRAFVVSRKPPVVSCRDAATGEELSSAPCAGDSDDAFYDAAQRRLYLVGGEGFVEAFDVSADGKAMTRVARVETSPKARTGLYVPAMHRIFVAAPALPDSKTPARILVFRTDAEETKHP